MNTRRTHRFLAIWAVGLTWTGVASAQPRAIDPEKSTMTVYVGKTGLFSAVGHNHEIVAPVAHGMADPAAHRVEVFTNASAMKVIDRDVSDKDRADIQSTMIGPEVLDAERYPEIIFRSSDFGPTGANAWTVHGDLTLHGQTRPVTVEVREMGGHYVGTSRFKQTDFGMKPVKVAGGAVRVKDEVRIEFDIQLAR